MTPRQNAVALFLFGLGANLYAHVLGYLAFSEIVLLVAAPIALFFGDFDWREPKIRLALVLLALWLGSALLTDYLQETDWSLALRGAARPIFLGGAMVVSYRLLRPNPGAAGWYFLGLVISNTVSMFIFKTGSIDIDEQMYDITISGSFEKQGIAIVMSAVPCLLFWKGWRFPVLAGAVTAVIGILSVFFGSRSAGGVMFVSGLAIAAGRFLPIESGRFRLSMRSVMLVVLLGVVGVFGAVELYESAAARGWLGEAASKKLFAQTQNKFGLLLGGRMDFLSGLLAISDSPLIGHGSWAVDTQGYMLHAAEIANAEVDPAYYEAMEAGLVRIPSHSQLLEAWVEHGLIAALFWFYIVWLLARCSLQGMFVRPELFPAVILLLLSRWWDLLFSPFGSRVAVGAAFSLFIVLVELADDESKKQAVSPSGSAQVPRLRVLVPRRRFVRGGR